MASFVPHPHPMFPGLTSVLEALSGGHVGVELSGLFLLCRQLWPGLGPAGQMPLHRLRGWGMGGPGGGAAGTGGSSRGDPPHPTQVRASRAHAGCGEARAPRGQPGRGQVAAVCPGAAASPSSHSGLANKTFPVFKQFKNVPCLPRIRGWE